VPLITSNQERRYPNGEPSQEIHNKIHLPVNNPALARSLSSSTQASGVLQGSHMAHKHVSRLFVPFFFLGGPHDRFTIPKKTHFPLQMHVLQYEVLIGAFRQIPNRDHLNARIREIVNIRGYALEKAYSKLASLGKRFIPTGPFVPRAWGFIHVERTNSSVRKGKMGCPFVQAIT
jgi:hypothetical protein